MPHPAVRNHTPFAYESLFLTDEDGVPQFVPLVQGSFSIEESGELTRLEDQPPPDLAGEWYGDPATASMKLEPQMAFMKPATDVVLLGHAYAPAADATETRVGIRVGPVSKVARVVGDRFLVKHAGATVISRPLPFERIPLVYERAFGGWDRRDADLSQHRCETRNPVGLGFRATVPDRDDEVPLPNIEYEDELFQTYGDRPAPAGFGFVAPNWLPRLPLAGTYDEAWDAGRKPLLPTDFDRRFFNAASEGLIAPGYLRGDEPVVVVGASPRGRVGFNLPGVAAPECTIEVRGGKRIAVASRLDTVIIDMDLERLTLIWRSHLAVRNGPHDVVSVEIGSSPEGSA